MPSFDYDVGIIGGGAAGLTTASGSARLGAKTLLIEKEPALGGDCLHYGCVPSKTLLHTAKLYHQARTMHHFGLPEVELPPVDFAQVAERIQSVIDTIQKHDSVERFCRLGALVEFGSPEFKDEHSIRLEGRTISARTWVVATGSSPAVPPIPGLVESGYLTNKDLFSLPQLPKSLVVLGAGPIAVEMAQAFTRLGTEVHVLQRSGQILSKEDKDMADMALSRLLAEGVRVHLNVAVQQVEKTGDGRVVHFTNYDGEAQRLETENILVALGRRPNVEGLGLDNAGVVTSAKGIEVDDRLRTAQKHIYAAGDVTGRHLFTHAAGYEGGIVVSNAVFHVPRKVDYSLLPWCTYTDPELASIGYNEKRAAADGMEFTVHRQEFAANDRSLAEGEEMGQIKLLVDHKDKPLGVQILGPHAGELVAEWVAALNGGVKTTTLAGAIHPYPTLAEVNKGVVGKLLEPKLFSEKMQKALKFFFHFKGRACGIDGVHD
ncbi:dihydrolipoyl dehydrogenase family protein [Desulfohalobium retbaense]|uniref:Pyridine nucleotide-disulphide oxidoreductase dimerization region n=1 Tax=Desulfohalobium retbaense (strain ATCC 49708 / DSM 5692 / JCM 16813 / HR100) TaxID=485915 RepID=C8X2Y7_DESRD|nr:FAD-dependent oxidoreductase [Desulfohalobium retbaense]ACV68784.1 pyridine nucleotide-disulphide oxidoreductase dimerization region [Desulfohalobium retbaense DSM 5692]